MAITPPHQGFIFWPIGTDDSTTIRISDTVYLQLDLRHMAKSEDEDDPAWPVIDELIAILPTLDRTPYLSVFALTHPDLDHCRGFGELKNRVIVSELWMSPRTFREFRENDDLCDDAQAFHDEAMRRVRATIRACGDPGCGNRIRIIGYDDLLPDSAFAGFPRQFLTIPGQTITTLDGQDLSHLFEAFVHAPFKDDSFGDRKRLQPRLPNNPKQRARRWPRAAHCDLSYPVINRIFYSSAPATLAWNVLLAPHHCSKSAMYWKDEGDVDETLKAHIVRYIANAASTLATSYRARNQCRHATIRATARLMPRRRDSTSGVVPNAFLCTHEHPNPKNPSQSSSRSARMDSPMSATPSRASPWATR